MKMRGYNNIIGGYRQTARVRNGAGELVSFQRNCSLAIEIENNSCENLKLKLSRN